MTKNLIITTTIRPRKECRITIIGSYWILPKKNHPTLEVCSFVSLFNFPKVIPPMGSRGWLWWVVMKQVGWGSWQEKHCHVVSGEKLLHLVMERVLKRAMTLPESDAGTGSCEYNTSDCGPRCPTLIQCSCPITIQCTIWWRCAPIQSSFHGTLELCDLKWSWQKARSPDKSLGIFQS